MVVPMTRQKKYDECASQVLSLMKVWIERECQTRAPDLRFAEWGKTVYAGSLTGASLDVLVRSEDARRMCEWIDEQTNRQATLLMAYVAAEMLGLKPSTFQPAN